VTVPLLQMSGISKRFPGVVALDDVSITVSSGEVVALVGENGAGKSTLMKVLAGLHRPDAGTVRIDGREVWAPSPLDAARYGIAVIHQELEVIDNLDVAGNVFLGREPARGGPLRLLHRQQLHADTQVLLDRLGATFRADTPVHALSTAQQQLVAIARALSMRTRVLVMDEPTSSLTLVETGRLFTIIRELRSQDVAVVYISHRLSEIETLADRVVVLRDGRNAGELARADIRRDTMVRMMVGRDVHRGTAAAAATRTGDVCLRLHEIRTQRYPAQTVSLDVRRGEILGVAGLIGAGRTELAEVICGIEPMLAAPRDAIVRGIYLIPEDRRRCGLVTAMSVRENISLPSLSRHARLGLVRRRAESEEARRVAGELGVKAPSLEVTTETLSGGNQQKVVLARWLSLSPRVIVFDEPTRGIDVGAKAEIYQLMRGLADRGVAIVMISSDMEEILANSDRVAVMHEGRITGILDRVECTAESIMQLAVA
jgi:ribose transport system ATP-binding protein